VAVRANAIEMSCCRSLPSGIAISACLPTKVKFLGQEKIALRGVKFCKSLCGFALGDVAMGGLPAHMAQTKAKFLLARPRERLLSFCVGHSRGLKAGALLAFHARCASWISRASALVFFWPQKNQLQRAISNFHPQKKKKDACGQTDFRYVRNIGRAEGETNISRVDHVCEG
jgi:hypothetical protein